MRGTHDPEKHGRRSIRLPNYDYSGAGLYFVTICTCNRICLLGEIVKGEMRLNGSGRVVRAKWENIPRNFPDVEMDAFVVMPNHLHGIIVITGDPLGEAPAPPLQYPPSGPPGRSIRGTRGKSVWQRNYYEQIIRNEAHLNRVRQYIDDNAACWAEDPENPARPVKKEEET